MGLLDTLKSAKNYLTGGGATVTLEIEGLNLKNPLKIKVKAQIGDADLEIKGVELVIKSLETVVIPNLRIAPPGTSLPPYKPQDARREEELYKEKIVISPNPARLLKNQPYTWLKEIKLGEKALPTFQGKHAKHAWFAEGVLLVSGRNPSSGWVEFKVQ